MFHYNQFIKDKGFGFAVKLFPETYRARDITDLVNSIDDGKIIATNTSLPIACFYNGKAIISMPSASFERLDDETCRLYDSQAEVTARIALHRLYRFLKLELLDMESMTDEEKVRTVMKISQSEPGSELRTGKTLFEVVLHYHVADEVF